MAIFDCRSYGCNGNRVGSEPIRELVEPAGANTRSTSMNKARHRPTPIHLLLIYFID